ncbi:MAG TPA: GYF domain-containing protein [Opitutaceae bacterium]|nr:GYF domain-containing protein [Opitutaceae bacterium]
MFTIIGGDGKEYGPVSAEQIRGWIAGGRANLDTKARAVGTEDWRRLGDFPEFAAAMASGAPPPATAGPARVTGPVDIASFAEALKARALPLDVFSCLSRSFELWKSNFPQLVGITLLVVIVQLVTGLIPIVGALSGLFLNGVFYGGLYYYYLGRMRGEHREAGDAFAGFTKGFVPLMLATLLTTLLTFAVILPFLAPFFFNLIKIAMAGGAASATPQMPSGGALLGFFLGVLVAMYLSISWVFTFALIIDRGLGPWTAMEVSRRVVSKQWFRVFFLVVLGTILAMLGLIGLVIGVIFTLPLVFGAILYAYEDLCNPPATSDTPAGSTPAAPTMTA